MAWWTCVDTQEQTTQINIWRIKAEHIPETQNTIADNLSRIIDGLNHSKDMKFSIEFVKSLIALRQQIDSLPRIMQRLKFFKVGQKSMKLKVVTLCSIYGTTVEHAKIRQEQLSAILVTPYWSILQVFVQLGRIAIKPIMLPVALRCCKLGPGAIAAEAYIPQGCLIAWMEFPKLQMNTLNVSLDLKNQQT
ncbi:MAG: hypothetical protein EZS28_017183 [Streblomastix strix]|uniref:Uncharacterized protein n=1 Tax=Streblomastix strix TaxID=222440 RepID=A0A5J4VY16_9EUKA|nr:MAG: hypothetical protein EZS28_017183 [Streblomastix strix]